MSKLPRHLRFSPFYHVKHNGPKVLRLVIFAVVLIVAALFFLRHQARAQIGEALMGMGVEMLRYEGAEYQQAPRTLMLNGAPIQFATGKAPHGMAQVLDYYEGRCRERDGRLHELVADLSQETSLLEGVVPADVDATMRQENSDNGFVACFDMGEESVGLEGINERLERFKASFDLTEFGHMRYIYATQLDDGSTHFVTFWTEGELRITEMFPATGDAPGVDVQGVPRVRGARRILSSWEVGEPQKVVMYLAEDKTAQDLESHYRRVMANEWNLLEIPEEERSTLGLLTSPRNTAPILVFERAGRTVGLVFVEVNHGTSVTVLESR